MPAGGADVVAFCGLELGGGLGEGELLGGTLPVGVDVIVPDIGGDDELVTSTSEPPEQPTTKEVAKTIKDVMGQISRFMRKTSS